MDIKGKVAIVTGASAGIGEAIARRLSAAGANVVMTARRGDRLEAIAGELPTQAAILAADIADPETPKRLLALALERFGRADILINNAGVLKMGRIDTIDIEDVTLTVRVNYEAVVRSSYLFARHFKAQGAGAIINISSVAAFRDSVLLAAYCGAKHAVEAFTGGLRIELAGTGVRVGTIAPGSTETEMYDIILDNMHPADKPVVKPADIAQGVVFMLEMPDNANIPRLQIYSSGEIM